VMLPIIRPGKRRICHGDDRQLNFHRFIVTKRLTIHESPHAG